MKHKLGLVLSGGGARGIAHLGILKALEEIGVKPSIISGTSAGAIAAAFYAKGFSAEEILEIIKKGNFFNFSSILFKKQGIFSMKNFEKIYAKYFPNNSFDELSIPIIISATDLLNGESVYFSSGNLSQCLLASSCIPVIFQPVNFNNTYYVDGAVLDNFPIEPLLSQCEKIIGVSVNSIKKESKEIHMRNIIDRTVHLSLSKHLNEKAKSCDVFIEPPDMSQFHILDLNKTDEIFNYGYNYACSMKNEIKALVS